MSKVVFVSGCGASYYPMLREWIASVRRFPEGKNVDICILDVGLADDQLRELKTLVKDIKNPDWPMPLPNRKIINREYLKACVCRPFLPQIFPNYDVYFWMDADMWVQDWAGIELFLQGAARKKVALVAQVDRGYPRAVRVKWLWRWPWKVRSFYFTNARKAFDFKTAKTLLTHHVLSAGVFVLHKDAPHWKRWQELIVKAMKKGNLFTAEQLSLGVLCHLENYEYEVLPAWAHWLCEFKPLWDEQKNLFVEPFLPHMPISVMHLSGCDAMRMDRSVTTDFKTTGGKVVQKSYRFPYSA